MIDLIITYYATSTVCCTVLVFLNTKILWFMLMKSGLLNGYEDVPEMHTLKAYLPYLRVFIPIYNMYFTIVSIIQTILFLIKLLGGMKNYDIEIRTGNFEETINLDEDNKK